MAQAVLHQSAQRVTPGWVPLCWSAGYPTYLPALMSHYGHGVPPPRRQDQGPGLKPRGLPLAELLDAQVVNTPRRRRRVAVQHRIICGTKAAGEPVLAVCGWQIHTAFVAWGWWSCVVAVCANAAQAVRRERWRHMVRAAQRSMTTFEIG
jgi:hypothetical protein